MNDRMTGVWVYLAQAPLFWLTVTLLVYQFASWLYARSRSFPLIHPVIASILMLVGLLLLTHTEYKAYFDGAQFIHFLLGPATVALAIPLYEQRAMLRRLMLPIVGALLIGSASAIAVACLCARLFGASSVTVLSFAPKSVTTPIAMGVAEQIGGLPALTAVFVILTGIIGGAIANEVLNLIGVKEHPVRGFAMGLAAHGVGTARAFQIHAEMGAFSGLAMGLNGAVTALIAPIIIRLLGLG
ncbi:LrgB family protein [Chloroflexia bacterium SDU3-3]|nr:LrgB family protein [Chloroflexia bacterium SDU3-3]